MLERLTVAGARWWIFEMALGTRRLQRSLFPGAPALRRRALRGIPHRPPTVAAHLAPQLLAFPGGHVTELLAQPLAIGGGEILEMFACPQNALLLVARQRPEALESLAYVRSLFRCERVPLPIAVLEALPLLDVEAPPAGYAPAQALLALGCQAIPLIAKRLENRTLLGAESVP